MPNYSKAYLNKMVKEFTAEFEALVNSEVKKSEVVSGKPLNKSEDGDSDEEKSSEKSSGGDSGGSDDSSASGSDGPPGGGSASVDGPPSASAGPAGGAPADPASAGGVPPADPAAGASGGDPVQALVQAYSQLSPEELQAHFFAMKQVLQTQTSAGADPAAGGDPLAASGAPPAPAVGADSSAVAPGPDAAAPMAGEGSKPVDPAATMALKSEFEKQLNLIKAQRDEALAKSQQLERSLTGLTDQLEKFVPKPERKAVTGKDLLKSEPQTQTVTLTRDQIIKKLTVVARSPDLKKSDRDAINKYTVGGVSADSIAHLLSEKK